jgi:hypothetical protein
MRFLSLIFLFSCVAEKGPLTYSLDGQRVMPATERPEVITFEYVQEKILVPKCLECHAWVSEPSEVNRRITPGAPDSSRIFRLMVNGRMPPRPAPAVDTSELEIMRDYINQLTR